MFTPKKNESMRYIIGLVVVAVCLVLIPTLSEFIIALHNHYSVYPAGTDTNMYGNAFLLQIILGAGLGLLVGLRLPFGAAYRAAGVICTVVALIVMPNVIPSFLPVEWCKYELTLYSCDNTQIRTFPTDVLSAQIKSAYIVNNSTYMLVYEPNTNYDFPDLQGKTIEWHGVLRSKANTEPWVKFFTITDPPDSSQQGQKIKYNPVGVFSDDKAVYVDIANDRGAGSGEGQLVRFMSTDDGQTWQQAGCYYFIPEQYYLAGTDQLDSFNPHALQASSNCVY